MEIPSWLSQLGTLGGQIVTGAIGAYLALWAKDQWTRSDQRRDADVKALKEIDEAFPADWRLLLNELDFYAGVPQRPLLRPLWEIEHRYPPARSHYFHDKTLNEAFIEILSASITFSEDVSDLTRVAGSGRDVTTKYKEDSEELRQQARAEAKELEGRARQLHLKWVAFLDLSRRQLRI